VVGEGEEAVAYGGDAEWGICGDYESLLETLDPFLVCLFPGCRLVFGMSRYSGFLESWRQVVRVMNGGIIRITGSQEKNRVPIDF
jgi:hypothetical protein